MQVFEYYCQDMLLHITWFQVCQSMYALYTFIAAVQESDPSQLTEYIRSDCISKTTNVLYCHYCYRSLYSQCVAFQAVPRLLLQTSWIVQRRHQNIQ